jgi:hypothetical protein
VTIDDLKAATRARRCAEAAQHQHDLETGLVQQRWTDLLERFRREYPAVAGFVQVELPEIIPLPGGSYTVNLTIDVPEHDSIQAVYVWVERCGWMRSKEHRPWRIAVTGWEGDDLGEALLAAEQGQR